MGYSYAIKSVMHTLKNLVVPSNNKCQCQGQKQVPEFVAWRPGGWWHRGQIVHTGLAF